MIKLSKIINLTKDFFFLGPINVRIKEVVIELFHGIELFIDSAFDFDDDALATFVVDHWDGFLIIVLVRFSEFCQKLFGRDSFF